MGRSRALACLCLLLVAAALAPGTAGGDAETPTIERVYPNPTTGGDVGEYVVVDLTGAEGNVTLSDGADAVSLSGREGTVAVSTDPAAARNLTDVRVLDRGGIELANGGETLRLRVDGDVVQRVRYADAPEGEIGHWRNGSLRWRPLGATDRPVAVGGPAEVRAFVLPDSPSVPIDHLRSADERLYLAGYTLTSERVADALVAAHERGATVRVLLEGEPVGGRTRAGARRLDRLAAAGVEVRVVGGPRARVTYHHAKYAVADDRALVMTENWKPAGTGGNGSRGWGVVTGQPAIVANLTETFAADAGWRDANAWSEFRAGETYERGEPAMGGFPRNIGAERLRVERTELLVAPDNAGDRVVATFDDADTSIDLIGASMGDWNDRVPTALRRAAGRGVEVRVLLSSAWYAEAENRRTVERFRAWADRTDAPLSARLAEPNGRYAKIHAKGAVVDGDTVVLGSLNWNDAAATVNREVVLLLHGEAVAKYYGDAFAADWGAGGLSLPISLLVAVVGCLLLAGVVLAKIRFEGDDAVGVGPPASGD